MIFTPRGALSATRRQTIIGVSNMTNRQQQIKSDIHEKGNVNQCFAAGRMPDRDR